jgi:2-keto-3-deoxy-L-rhamnonate aldolase RhmA
MSTTSALARLRDGGSVLMLGIRHSRTTDIVRMAKSSGHDAVLLDMEHSALSIQTVVDLCATAVDLGLWAFVRIPERDYGTIGRVLDGGAHGIVVPRVETAAQAAEVARACRFPSTGQRSQIGTGPAFGMRPTPAAEMNPAVDAEIVVQVILETPTGIANADEIAAQPGVDVLVLGANDFTAELGDPGNYDHPAVDEAVEAIARACRSHGKLFMIAGIRGEERYQQLAALGASRFILTGMDGDLLFGALTAKVQALEPSKGMR